MFDISKSSSNSVRDDWPPAAAEAVEPFPLDLDLDLLEADSFPNWFWSSELDELL